MSSILDTFNSLQTEFSKISKDLQSVEDNLKKLTGGQSSTKRNLKRTAPEGDSNVFVDSNVDEPPKRNKFIGKAFSRVHGPNWQPKEPDADFDDKEDLHHKPVLLSQVVPAIKEVKSRNEALEERPPDEKSKARNRRMFGIILGTLQKFQSEESQRKQTTAKRVEIEEKLDRMAEKERDVIRKEKKELYKKRRESQAHLRRIELKMERVQIHQEWEKSHKTLVNFIQTKTKPHLFYLPKEHTTESEKRWKQTKDKYRLILAEKRAKVQKELSEIDEMYKKEVEMDDEEDRDDDFNRSVEMDSHENTNNDPVEPMEESTEGEKVCRNENYDSSDGKDKNHDIEIENHEENNYTKGNDEKDNGADNNRKDSDEVKDVGVLNKKDICNEVNEESNSIISHTKNSDSKSNTDRVDSSNNSNQIIIDSSMDNQVPNQHGDADKSSSEQLAEKEFEPIYDDDE